MAIRTINTGSTFKARVTSSGGTKVKQVAIGSSSSAVSTADLNDLADVNATETDDGLLSYDAATDKWVTTTVLDGGTF
jgi:hypothetical protein